MQIVSPGGGAATTPVPGAAGTALGSMFVACVASPAVGVAEGATSGAATMDFGRSESHRTSRCEGSVSSRIRDPSTTLYVPAGRASVVHWASRTVHFWGQGAPMSSGPSHPSSLVTRSRSPSRFTLHFAERAVAQMLLRHPERTVIASG